MKKISIVLLVLMAAVMLPSVTHMTPTALGQHIPGLGGLRISIKVTNLDTGMPIKRRDTLTAVTPFQVTVTTNGIDCAGQFVVTALGDPSVGAPPSVLVQFIPFIIGPAVGSNSASGGPLDSTVLQDGSNDWKITASCNGAEPLQRAFAFFEFFVQLP